MDYYNTGVTGMEGMDTGVVLQCEEYVRYGQPQDHVSAHYGSVAPTTQFRHAVHYQSRSHKPSTHYDEYDYDSPYVTVQYENHGPAKNEVHYPSKTEVHYPSKSSSWQSRKYSAQQDGGNAHGFNGSKPSHGGQGSWQMGSYKEPNIGSVDSKGTSVNYGGWSAGPRGGMAQKAHAPTGAQTALASYAYENKTSFKGNAKPYSKPYDFHQNKPKSHLTNQSPFPTKPVTILRNPSSQTPMHQNYSSSEFMNAKNALKLSIHSSFVKPGFSASMKNQTAGIKIENGKQQKYPWKYTADGAIRKKVKPTPAQRNMRFKKVVQPKNAVMCLNELVNNVTYNMEQEGNGSGIPTIMVIEVNGQKYRGYGSSKQMSKQAAAEAALVSFVKPPAASKAGDEEDATPWTTLASFAMFKLFNEWRDGRIGTNPPGFANQQQPFGSSNVMDSTLAQTLQTILNNQCGTSPVVITPVPQLTNAAMNMGNAPAQPSSQNQKNGGKMVLNPAKQVPANAAATHPVMLLHMMRPGLTFNQSNITKENQQSFCVTCVIDGRTFSGEGANVKKAKYELALKANQALFGVVSTFVGAK